MNFEILQRGGIPLVALLLACPAACHRPPEGPVAVSDPEIKDLRRDGRYYIAGTPSDAGLHRLRADGVTHVIDLRRPEEGTAAEADAARRAGMDYVNIPMKSDTLTDEQAAEFLAAMKAAGDEPVLIHCAGGSRAGGMYGLYLGASGRCTTQQALEKARAAGLKNDKLGAALEEYFRQHKVRP